MSSCETEEWYPTPDRKGRNGVEWGVPLRAFLLCFCFCFPSSPLPFCLSSLFSPLLRLICTVRKADTAPLALWLSCEKLTNLTPMEINELRPFFVRAMGTIAKLAPPPPDEDQGEEERDEYLD